jgi:HKD family nuclease
MLGAVPCVIIGEMEFLTVGKIGDAVCKVLSEAVKVRIASAFFLPGKDTLELLNATKNLTLVISEEFTVNNPEKLEALTSAVTRSVPTDSKDGKLHAKVFLAEMPGGSDWVLVGSANLTDQGLFFNQEACILLSSLETGDRKAIADIKDWFAKLYARSRAIDMKQAKAIWAAHGGQQRMPKLKVPAPAPGYYALKTTSGGSGGKEHWGMFEEDSAVAIGWEDVAGDPSKLSETALRKALVTGYPHFTKSAEDFAFNTFRKFIDMPNDSIVMVCRGYAPNQVRTPVRIYAFARVVGSFYVDTGASPEWRFKRKVVFQPVEQTLSANVLKALLSKDSFMQTMHNLDQGSVEAVASELGIEIEV